MVRKRLLSLRRALWCAPAAAPMSEDPNHHGSSRRWITREIEASLRRLGTDHVDLYRIHRPDPDTDIEETLSVLPDLIGAGKIRAIGCSAFPAERPWAPPSVTTSARRR